MFLLILGCAMILLGGVLGHIGKKRYVLQEVRLVSLEVSEDKSIPENIRKESADLAESLIPNRTLVNILFILSILLFVGGILVAHASPYV